jgi:hypothetical protein
MRKFRRCPRCKSRKGFSLNIQLGGYQDMAMDFKGKILSSKREGVDKTPHWATCLSCGKAIETERLQLDTEMK